MKMIETLLRIKHLREADAQAHLLGTQLASERAKVKKDDAAEVLETFSAAARQEEDGMYDDLCSRVVRVREIESVIAQVAILENGKLERRESLTKAEIAFEEAHEALEQARMMYRDAMRATQKFRELATRHAEKVLQAAERSEENEIEEIVSQRYERGEEKYFDEEACS